MRDTPLDDATIAVVAHGLLNSLAVVEASLHMVGTPTLDLTSDQRDVVMDAATRHLELVVGVLRDLSLGYPRSALESLKDDGAEDVA